MVGGCRSIFINPDDIEMIRESGDQQTCIRIQTKLLANGIFFLVCWNPLCHPKHGQEKI